MIAERYRIATSKRGVSPKKKKVEPPAKPKAVKPRPAWDSFLIVPEDAYRLKAKEALQKKNSLVSGNNNIMRDHDVSVSYRPMSVLKERHPNVVSPEKLASPAPKKEKKESDALDLIMSAKEKEVGRSVAQKSPAKTRGTSSFAPPTKSAKPKTAKAKNSAEAKHTQHTQHDDLPENDDDLSIHEFDLSTKLFGHSHREINDTVTNVVKDNHQRLLQERTSQLSQAFTDTSPISFKPHKDTILSSQAARSIRTPSPAKTLRVAKINTPTGDLNSSTHTVSAKLNTPRSVAKVSAPSAEKDYDLVYVADEIRSLFSELKYYEELSGRRSILDTREEMEEMLQDEALLNPESHKPVMRYLVQLVCQSMTYLLKSEVDLQEERVRYEALNAKFETLNSLLSDDSVIPGVSAIRNGMSSGGGSSGDVSGGMSDVEYGVGGDVYGASGVDNGIAYTEDDLYPSQFMSPVRTTNHTTTNSHTTNPPTDTTPYSTNNTTNTNSTNTNTNTSRHDAPSPSLKMIAQQYANDDLYPIPIDSEHSLHYDDYDYEVSFVVSDVKSTPIRGNSTSNTSANYTNHTNHTNTTNITSTTTATPTIHGAKVTSTPARFHEQFATLTNPEHKASKLAMNAPPSMVLSTPVRSVHGSVYSSVYGGTSGTGASGGVSSTAPTPQIMPYNTNLATNHTRDYTALGVYSTNTTPNNTSNTRTSYYTQINSPAVYVDAYSSYLPSAPAGDKARGASGNGMSGDDVLSTPARQNTNTATTSTGSADFVSAGLERVDELIRYSRSIGNINHSSSGSGASGSGSHTAGGDEYSTIARLSENKFHPDHSTLDINTSTYSMQYHDTSAYSVGNVYGGNVYGGNVYGGNVYGAGAGNVSNIGGVSGVQDTSVNSVDATPARVKKQNPYSHLSGSVESAMPPPPPTSHYTSTSSGTSGASGATSGGMYVRQPAQATAAREQLLHTMHPTTHSNTTTHTNHTSNNTNNHISSNDSVHSVHSTGSMQGLSGTSASDWLFGAFPNTTTNTTTANSNGRTSAGKVGKSIMLGKAIGTSISSGGVSANNTPETHYVPPTTTMHTLPTTPYTTTHATPYTTTSASGGLVTPTRGNKTHTPKTVDMFNPTTNTTSAGFSTDRLANYTTTPTTNTTSSNTNTSMNTSLAYHTTTPPPTAAVPTYLLSCGGSSGGLENSNKEKAAGGLVQVRATTRFASPVKGTKASKIPLKASEGVSIIVPIAVPSPHSMPVHPFANVTTPPTSHTTMTHKLHSLQQHYSEYTTSTDHSNATTPTLTLEPWQAVQKRVYDARNGSF